jgi:pyridoxal phosphate enzyme (YggS family)
MVNQNNWNEVNKKCLAHHANLVAVTKTRSVDELQDLYQTGQRHFGENRVQELLDKKDKLPEDIQWHLIGHLQRNKVKYIAPFVNLIHSVDSLRLLKEINKEAEKNNRIIDCLLQFHVAQEDSKFGIPPSQKDELVKELKQYNLEWVRIRGIMGMASFVDDQKQVKGEFSQLRDIYNDLKNNFFTEKDSFDTLSIGMSGDYELALQEGSTMVRIGSKLFT